MAALVKKSLPRFSGLQRNANWPPTQWCRCTESSLWKTLLYRARPHSALPQLVGAQCPQALSWIVVSTGFTAPTHAIYQQKLPPLGSLVDLSQCLACLMVDPESLTALEGDQPKPRLARDFCADWSKRRP